MNKLAIVTDTGSGLMPDEGKKDGIFVIPIPFTINGSEYLDGVSLTTEDFYRFLSEKAEVHTSQPTAMAVTGLWDEILKSYDELVYIPLSSGLSGSCASANLYAEDYNGRVQVVNNQRISVTQRQSAYDALKLAEEGKSAKEIKEILETSKFDSSIYIMLDTLDYLKKGGRVTPAAAMLAKVLNLKPVLQIQGEKLDAFSKCRGIKPAKKIMVNAIKEDIEKRFGGLDSGKGFHLAIAHTMNYDAAEEFAADLRAEFPDYDITINPLSLVIACHIGPGSLACAVSKAI
ncbi:MAG: DegV family protein [Lachnospiraceae bacterium]|nr:DegV family protein [Lachnospiraceae bacterium]